MESNRTFGAILKNIDLSMPIDAATFLKIQAYLFQKRVIVLNNQDLDDEDLLNFALKFGPLFDSQNSPVLGKAEVKNPIVVVGNKADEYKDAFLGYQEVLPHSDHQWTRTPSAISMLYALDIQENAAATTWTDMTQVYSKLDEELKSTIEHVKTITYNPFYRPFGSVDAKYVDRREDTPPGEYYKHPLVRTHPITGERILYMHRAYEMEFADIQCEKGLKLWSELNTHVDRNLGGYTHNWKNGDLVIWDNRATIHYRPVFGSDVRRVLKRISIGGERPF